MAAPREVISPNPSRGDDQRNLSFSIQDLGIAGRGYDCVGDIASRQTGSYAGDFNGYGRDDEVAAFCFDGPCPAPALNDTSPPTVRWVSPVDGATDSGVYTERAPNTGGRYRCLVAVSDDAGGSGIDRTENYVDGKLNDTQFNPPYACEWDTRTVPDGRHQLTVRAYDRKGNASNASIAVDVRNATAEPVVIPPAPNGPVTAQQPAPNGIVVTPPAAGGTAGIQRTSPKGLSMRRAKSLVRRKLAKQFGKRYSRRARRGSSLSCRKLSTRRARCRVAWRYRGARYAGSIAVTETSRGSRVTPRIRIRRR